MWNERITRSRGLPTEGGQDVPTSEPTTTDTTTATKSRSISRDHNKSGGEPRVEESREFPSASEPGDLDRTDLGKRFRNASNTVVDAVRDDGNQLSVLMAELELRKAELDLAQKAAAAAQSKLELVRAEAALSASGGAASREERTSNWVEQQRRPPYVEHRQRGRSPSRQQVRHRDRDYETQFANYNREAHTPISRQIPELPTFDGNVTEWIAFRAEFEDSAPMFSRVNNVSRIRKALRGEARTAVKSIMYTVSDPHEIMEALERHFGDPEEIVLTEIHNVKKMPRLSEDNSNIVSFAGHVANVVATIRALRQDKYLYAPELVNKIVNKLNIIIRYEWTKYRCANPDAPDLVAMASFLNEVSGAARRTHSRPTKSKANVHAIKSDAYSKPRPPRSRDSSSNSSDTEIYEDEIEQARTVATLNSKPRDDRKPAPQKSREQTAVKRDQCIICNGNHKINSCAEFLKSPVADRWELAKNSKLCFRCLGANHRRPIKCKYVPCGINQCEAGHHKLLHGLSSVAPTASTPASVSNVNHVRKSNTYLKVVPVEVTGPLGTISTYALLDEGSSLTLIERDTADQLAPRKISDPLTIEGVGGHQIEDRDSCQIKLSIRGTCSKETESVNAHTIARLNLASQEVSREVVEKCEHLKDIIDELCYSHATPTILIGQDNWHLIISRQILSGKKALPVASLTKLGWVLHGQYSAPHNTIAIVNHVRPRTTEDEILIEMKKHFSIESLGIESRAPKSDPNQRALDILDSTCEKIPGENRYRAGLLWTSDDVTLPDNRSHALRRLYSLENKLDRDAKLKTDYQNAVKNLIDKGYAEIVSSRPPADSPRVWYLPHFPTFHAQKGSMRLVFDAKARAYNESLNQRLLTGPDLLESLFGVLIRFREGKTAVTSDVKEMFLQVEVIDKDRDSLRFLWRGEDRSNPPQEHRMKRLIFGAASSPATALYVKNKNASSQKTEFPVAAEKTIRNTYMDDLLIALDESEQEARQIVNDLYQLNLKASFELRGFASNNPNVIRDVNPSSRDTSVIGKNETERTLGLKWNHKRDSLGFNVNLRNTPVEVLDGIVMPTKRQVTSSAMSIFDPIGYVSPITVLGKALMQEIWRTGIEWDQKITPECNAAWLSFVENIQQLKELEIPRYVAATNRRGELHTFCDASEKIYASAVYFVSTDNTGQRTSTLVAAKARVAPLKTISIPRLELQSCVLGTRLAKSVCEQTDYEITKCHFWSDSRTVLAWIKSDPRTFKSFVAHRLAEIEDSTTPADWHWVPSLLNVADDATKGAPAQFGSNHRWFHGPEFIRQNSDRWPVGKPNESPLTPTGEEKSAKVVNTVSRVIDKHNYLPEVGRFSKFSRLVRSSAQVMVAVETFKAKLLRGNPGIRMNNGHLKIAELLLIKRSQRISFEEEMKLTEDGKPLPRKSPLSKVAVKLNKVGILILDSRVDRDKMDLPVLHAKEPFTKLLIQHFHELYNHGNHATVINELKQRYYIVGLRGCIRFICNKCQWCRTYKGTTLKVPVGDLPIERLQANQPAFTATAIDLFGPMNITIGRRHEKRWGVLFTCLTTRAVHLELAASLSASSTILALRRMMTRRGAPTVIYTDNGTNFVGSERELLEAKRTLSEDAINHASTRSIIWKKIPPGNPAAGGAWERLVGCVKAALKITLREKAPHEEVLHTLLLEAEHMVNSRPLTPVNPDIHEEALTPNHFLLQRSNALSPLGVFKDQQMSLSSWKAAQALADTFWKRWTSEYRHTLYPRPITSTKAKELEVGDIVIIADNTMPRGSWPRGIIEKTYPGPDGHVRVTDIHTRAGTVRRPTNRLIWICSAK